MDLKKGNEMLLLVVIVLCTMTCSCTSFEDQRTAVQDLIGRVLGSAYSQNITVTVSRSDLSATTEDSFWYSCNGDGTMMLGGTSGVAAANGLHHIMRSFLQSSVTWGADATGWHIAHPLPLLPSSCKEQKRTSLGAYRYYFNTCTFGYTAAWWNITQWQREIDWMALHGINLPLASLGSEYAWVLAFEQFGLSVVDMQDYLSGPAFLPWNRMGNLHGWGGPMSLAYIKAMSSLQIVLLTKMRSIGMEPILPAFDGHVPNALVQKFPNSSFYRAEDWCGLGSEYSENYLLSPTDPLFPLVANAVIKSVNDLYGNSRFYNADTWNEMDPPTSNATFLTASSHAVYTAITSMDPNAVWIMQGWLFYNAEFFWTDKNIEAYLGGVPKENLIILDLTSDLNPVFSRTHSYFGYSFIWCMLHNYGGRRGFYGNLTYLSMQPVLDYMNPLYPNMVGVGLTMEATMQNEVAYELFMDVAWRPTPMSFSDLTTWIQGYAKVRYPAAANSSLQAFLPMTINNGPYLHSVPCCYHFTVLDDRPWIYPSSSIFTGYDGDTVVSGFRLMMKDAVVLLAQPDSDAFRYDLVDFARQVISNFLTDYLHCLVPILRLPKIDDEFVKVLFAQFCDAFDAILVDADTLLGVDPNFLFGRWMEHARLAAANSSDVLLFDFNARTQVTTWGPDGHIHDYASKPWNGLVGSAFRERWKFLFSEIVSNWTSRPVFNQALFNKRVYENVEFPFTMNSSRMFRTTPDPNTVPPIQKVLDQYTTLNVSDLIISPNTAPIANVSTVITSTWHQDPGVMYQLCLRVPSCIGFAEGKLYSVVNESLPTPGVTQYLIQSSMIKTQRSLKQ